MTDPQQRCPRSSFPLTRLRIGGIDTDVCEDCGGLWLDHSTRLNCPRHPAVVMLRRRFSPSSPVEIDECPECGGVWLDADEFARIRR